MSVGDPETKQNSYMSFTAKKAVVGMSAPRDYCESTLIKKKSLLFRQRGGPYIGF